MSRIGLALALAGIGTLLWSSYCAWRVHREEASVAAAVSAVHVLVEGGLAARGPEIDLAATRASTAMTLWPTPDAVGVSTLVEVWRLDVLGGQRDPRRFDAIIGRPDASLPGRAASALASFASCRGQESCPDAEGTLPAVWGDLVGTRWDGLRAPLLHAWLEMWAQRGYQTGSVDAWRRVRAGCLGAPEQLEESSPDGVLGLCLASAGALADYEQWFAWARVSHHGDVLAPWGLDEARLGRVFTTPSPGCRDLRLKMSSRWGTLVPDVVTAEHGFCYAAGMLAMGCEHEAAEVIASGRQVFPGAPWAEITSTYAPGQEHCYLDGD